ncbi:MAG: hypothetical protein WD473_03300 [Acidimicrobiia bacterium]
MRRVASLLLALSLLAGCLPKEPDASVLFIGNSYTFYNNLPQMVSDLADSAGQRIEVDSVAVAGAWLEDHIREGTAGERIRSGDFDYVVIQEQSAVPSDPNLARERMYPAAIALASDAALSGASLVLFETWGHLSGFSQTGHSSYQSMQNAINSTYHELSDLLGKPLAPVGEAWQISLTSARGIRLHQSDRSHPTLEGSYLAALVITATITGESPDDMTADLGVPTAVANLLREYATTAVAG